MRRRGTPRRVDRGRLPGFGLALGFTLLYLSLLVLLPVAALAVKAFAAGPGAFWAAVADERTLAAFRLSFLASFAAASLNLVFGLLVAWVLERYDFPGKRVVDALVDLPFALPTAVAGIALTAMYSPNGWLGRTLEGLGVTVAYTPLGVVVALTFIGLPFVVRTVQPVLASLDPEVEAAAVSLGARPGQVFWRVILPELGPAAATGFVLALARSLGEYGSVIFIAGNLPLTSEITPLLVMIKLEQYDYAGAAAIATVFLVLSFVLLLSVNLATWRRTAVAP